MPSANLKMKVEGDAMPLESVAREERKSPTVCLLIMVVVVQ